MTTSLVLRSRLGDGDNDIAVTVFSPFFLRHRLHLGILSVLRVSSWASYLGHAYYAWGALGDFETPRLSKAAGVTRRTNVRTRSTRPVSGHLIVSFRAAYGGLHPSNYQIRRARSLSLSQEDLPLSFAKDYRIEQSTNAEQTPRRLQNPRMSEFLGHGTNRYKMDTCAVSACARCFFSRMRSSIGVCYNSRFFFSWKRIVFDCDHLDQRNFCFFHPDHEDLS